MKFDKNRPLELPARFFFSIGVPPPMSLVLLPTKKLGSNPRGDQITAFEFSSPVASESSATWSIASSSSPSSSSSVLVVAVAVAEEEEEEEEEDWDRGECTTTSGRRPPSPPPEEEEVDTSSLFRI